MSVIVDWQTQLKQYEADAQHTFNALTQPPEGQARPSDYMLARVTDLLRTYTMMPYRGAHSATTDEKMLQLASTLYVHIQPRGLWGEIRAIWPTLNRLADTLVAPELSAMLLLQLAIVYLASGWVDKAHELYQQILHNPVFDSFPLEFQTEVLHQSGLCLLSQGKQTAAEQTLIHGLEISAHYQRLPAQLYKNVQGVRTTPLGTVWETRSYLYNILGNIAWHRGQHAKARRYYQESLAIFCEHDQVENLACVAYQGLGRLYLIEERYAEALPLLLKNYQIRHRRGEHDGRAHAAIYLAAAYIGCQELNRAEELLNEAYAACQGLGSQPGKALCHMYYGHLEIGYNRIDSAIVQWQQALQLFHDVPSSYEERQTLTALSLQYLRQGQCQEAHRCFAALLQNLADSQPLPHSAA